MWNKDENQCFKDNREHVLALMEHLHILGRPKVYVEGHSVQVVICSNHYYKNQDEWNLLWVFDKNREKLFKPLHKQSLAIA